MALVNPLRARCFAEALGQLARTDRLDAAMLALFAERNPDLSRFYRCLRLQGKPAKLALTAVARKLVVLANRLVAENRSSLPQNT